MVVAAQHGRQIEAKAVDVHLIHPVAQTVHHQLQHARMADVERVAATAVVFVLDARLRLQAVVAGVVQAPKAQRRSGFVGLGGVVVYDVEQDLDAGFVK